MTRAYNLMPTPEGIGAGQTATCRLPIGYTYDGLVVRMNEGAVPADVAEADWGSKIDELRVMVNGDAKIQVSAADLVSLNKFYGHSHVDGALPIFFSRPWMRTIMGEDQTSYKTAGGVASFTLEIDLAAGLTINSLEVDAWQSAPTYPDGSPKVWGAHYRLQKYAKTVGVTGEHEIADIQRGTYSAFAMHLKTANVSDLEVHSDGKRFFKAGPVARAHQAKIAGRAIQSGFTHIDFAPTNRLSDALPMAVQDLRLKANFTGTGAFPLYVESIQGASMVAS